MYIKCDFFTMTEWMNEWTNEWMNEWMIGHMNEWMYYLSGYRIPDISWGNTCVFFASTYRRTINIHVHSKKNARFFLQWMNKRMNEWMNEWMNEHMNECTIFYREGSASFNERALNSFCIYEQSEYLLALLLAELTIWFSPSDSHPDRQKQQPEQLHWRLNLKTRSS